MTYQYAQGENIFVAEADAYSQEESRIESGELPPIPEPRTIDDWSELSDWLVDLLSRRELRNYNSVLVDFAEFVLGEVAFGDTIAACRLGIKRSFVGMALRRTEEATDTKRYSALLMELAGSLVAKDWSAAFASTTSDKIRHRDQLPSTKAIAIGGLVEEGLFRYVGSGNDRWLVGSDLLLRTYGLTVRVAVTGSPDWDVAYPGLEHLD